MKINVIEFTDLSIIEDVWALSRPNLDRADAADIINIDAPINDFPSIVLEVESTILEREIIASFRDHIMWAKTSRVNCGVDWRVPDGLYKFNRDKFEEIRAGMSFMQVSGAPQDVWRLQMPVTASTEYMIKISPRLLIKITRHFESLCDKAAWLRDSYYTLMSLIQKFSLQDAYERYTSVNVNKPIGMVQSGRIGDYITITVDIPFSLRTHLIRHNQLSVTDNLINFINQPVDKILNSNITVQISASVSIWENVCSKRSCWIAHYGMWGQIIRQINNYVSVEGMLPCRHGLCPYSEDADARYTDKDPGLPCPIHAGINKRSVSVTEKELMERYVINEKRPFFWLDKIGELK